MRSKKMLGLSKNKDIKKQRMSPLPLMKLTTYIGKLCKQPPYGTEYTETGRK